MVKLCLFCDSFLGCTNVVGEPHYGHLGVTGPGHGGPDARPPAKETVRPHQATHIPHHDEEHPGPGGLHDLGHILFVILW